MFLNIVTTLIWASKAESSSEVYEKVSASEEEAVTETERADENVESSYSDDSSADEAKRRKSAEKPKPAPSNSNVTKSSKKAPKKSNKRNKSLSEEETEDLCGQLEVVSVTSTKHPRSARGNFIPILEITRDELPME